MQQRPEQVQTLVVPAVGIRAAGTILGEATGGSPFTNSTLYCEENQLGGIAVSTSRDFTNQGTNYTVSLSLAPPANPTELTAELQMDVNNQSTRVSHGI